MSEQLLKLAGLPIHIPQDLPTLDTAVMESMDADSSFLEEVCNSYLIDAPKRLAAIQTALSQADALSLEHAAHAMKSLSSCVGAASLTQLCSAMEAVGKRKCISSAHLLMNKVVSEYEKVQTALQNYKKTL